MFSVVDFQISNPMISRGQSPYDGHDNGGLLSY